MTTTSLAVGLLAVAALAAIVIFTASANRKRKAIEDVPPAMRPAYSDQQLETTVFERYQAWGLVMTLLFAVFFPLYYFNESRRLNAETREFFVASVVRGEESYANLCAECHGTEGSGGAAPAPSGDGSWPAPNLRTVVQRYADNLNIKDIELFVRETIEQGRPGTPMPTWGAAYGGPLNDQQVDDLVNWILANQEDEATEAQAAAGLTGEELYRDNCAKCHGADREGVVGPSLVGVTAKHSDSTLLGILRNGIYVPTGAIMPPWQNGYMYTDARYTDDALERIIGYLKAQDEASGHGRPPDEADGDDEVDGSDEPDAEPTEA